METLLPALARVVEAIRQHAPGRDVEAFGLPTFPAALAFGCAFLSTSGLRASWREITPGHPDQLWTLAQPRGDSGFKPKIMGKDANARDIAVLVSIADNAEPLFAEQSTSASGTRPGHQTRTLSAFNPLTW